MKKVVFTICLLAISTFVFGQYTNNLPNFNNNPLFFNPAYAGSSGTLDASILHYRSSNPFGTDGDVSLLSLSSPIGKGNWNIGGNLMHNDGYYIDFTGLDGIVSYDKTLKNGAKLSFGALASLERNHIEVTFHTSQSGNPLVFDDQAFNPQFGLGLLYEGKRGYLSFSSTDLFEHQWTYEDQNGTEYSAAAQSDFYISSGLNFETFNGKLQILPSATYHRIYNNELFGVEHGDLELGTSLVILDKIWLGGAFRYYINGQYFSNANEANAWAGVSFKNGLRVSGKIEWSVTPLRVGTLSRMQGGLMLGYRVVKDTESPYLGRRNFF